MGNARVENSVMPRVFPIRKTLGMAELPSHPWGWRRFGLDNISRTTIYGNYYGLYIIIHAYMASGKMKRACIVYLRQF